MKSEMLIIGDIQVHSRRADPTTAFNRMRDTLKKADLVYANLEGLLVKSAGTTIDIPDKPEWAHPGPDGVKALKASNIAVVGVANNVASGRANILKSLGVLDANGIIHTGAGRNIDLVQSVISHRDTETLLGGAGLTETSPEFELKLLAENRFSVAAFLTSLSWPAGTA